MRLGFVWCLCARKIIGDVFSNRGDDLVHNIAFTYILSLASSNNMSCWTSQNKLLEAKTNVWTVVDRDEFGLEGT